MVRRLGLALGGALGFVLLLIGAAFAFAQTGPGQRAISAALERALAGPETRVEVVGLEGLVPFDLRLTRLTIADPEGVWLELAGLHLSWSPTALLRGRLEVSALGADRIKLSRLPPTSPATSDEPFRLPELPTWLPPVALDRLALPQIELGPEVLGEAASFSLAGRLTGSDDGRTVVLALDAERVDRPTASATLDARLSLDPAALDLTLNAAETGGLLARLSGRPDAGDFTLRLAGSGPLDAWTGDLKVDVERLASADAKLKIALAAQPTIRPRRRPAAGPGPAARAAGGPPGRASRPGAHRHPDGSPAAERAGPAGRDRERHAHRPGRARFRPGPAFGGGRPGAARAGAGRSAAPGAACGRAQRPSGRRGRAPAAERPVDARDRGARHRSDRGSSGSRPRSTSRCPSRLRSRSRGPAAWRDCGCLRACRCRWRTSPGIWRSRAGRTAR